MTTTRTALRPCCDEAYLRHCHSTYVLHQDGTEECSDPTCDTPAEGHGVVIPCGHLHPRCECH